MNVLYLRHMRPSQFGFPSLPPVTPMMYGAPGQMNPGGYMWQGQGDPQAQAMPVPGLRRPDTMTTIGSEADMKELNDEEPGSVDSSDDEDDLESSSPLG